MKQFSFWDENHRGRLERFDYVGAHGAKKYALIYLPWGYDENPDRRYDILYLIHGGGGNPDSWTDSCPIKNMLDRSIAAGEAKPMIVVFPTFYSAPPQHDPKNVDGNHERNCVMDFQTEEIKQFLLPAVEGAYRSFAGGTDLDSLRRSRDHRAFGGFSMGGVNTWYAFTLHLDCFSVFVPLSGDCWAAGPKGGGDHPAETAAALRESVRAQGFGPDDFAIFAATGTEDIAYPNLTPQIEAMKPLDDMFRYSDDWGQGNLHYLVGEGLAHNSDAVNQYLYNYLPFLFRR